MITHYINYKQWNIKLCYNVNSLNKAEIISTLIDLDCVDDILMKAYDILDSIQDNAGFTFANPKTKEILIVIGQATESKEFLNTLMHELYHCSDFISKSSIYKDIETPAYIVEDLLDEVFPIIYNTLCKSCN